MLWQPVLTDCTQSVSTANNLPWWWLACTAIGVAVAFSRSRWALPLAAATATLPVLLAPYGLSSRRAVPFMLTLALWSGACVDVLPEKRRVLVAVLLSAMIVAWGSTTYFSDAFWRGNRTAFCSVDCHLPEKYAPVTPDRCGDTLASATLGH